MGDTICMTSMLQDKAIKVTWIKYFYESTNSLRKNYTLESAGVKNMNIFFRSNFSECIIPNYFGGHSGRVVTLSPPTS